MMKLRSCMSWTIRIELVRQEVDPMVSRSGRAELMKRSDLIPEKPVREVSKLVLVHVMIAE